MGYYKSPLTGITTARGPIFSLVFLLRNTENIFLNLFAAEYLEETQLTELEEIIRQDNGAVSLIRQSGNFNRGGGGGGGGGGGRGGDKGGGGGVDKGGDKGGGDDGDGGGGDKGGGDDGDGGGGGDDR